MPAHIHWVIVDAENIESKGEIKINSKISLRGAYGTYLNVGENSRIMATSSDVREDTTFLI